MKGMKFRKPFILLAFMAILLSGCMYPNERKAENQMPIDQQVALVQEAIDRYREETSVLPIATKEAETPIYEKYVIDFSKLIPQYIPYIPGAAFEQGGSFLFVLTNVETQPTVRLLDLKLIHEVGDIQSRVNYYHEKNKSLPVAGVVRPGYFQIDFKRIGVKEEKGSIQSPVTGDALPVIMSVTGQVGIDYQTDLEKISQSTRDLPAPKGDIRDLIPEHSLYVPVKSFPYTYEDEKIVLASNS